MGKHHRLKIKKRAETVEPKWRHPSLSLTVNRFPCLFLNEPTGRLPRSLLTSLCLTLFLTAHSRAHSSFNDSKPLNRSSFLSDTTAASVPGEKEE
uniref:Uncharacterized protein n=1 Tax=Anguilla anguilla TaxID=7936 RepID=A0A0E9WYC8_ANGAN